MYKLINISVENEKVIEEYVLEHSEEEIKNGLNGGFGLNSKNVLEWIKKVNDYEKGINIENGHVGATTLLFMKEKELIGLVNIRHELNDYLLNYSGHVGYGFRPSARGKGYAKEMMPLILKYCKENLKLDKILIACDSENIASRKTIMYANPIQDESNDKDGRTYLRFWIAIKK